MTAMRPLLRPIVMVFVLAMAACGGDDTSTTTPTTTGPSSQLFEGQLQRRGDFQFFSFTVTTAGNVSVTLASVTTASSPGTSLSLPLGVGLGQPAGTDCNLTQQTTTAPGLAPQLTGSNFSPAIYCVKIFDVGNQTTTVNYTITVAHP
jgi:hypothetical protein